MARGFDELIDFLLTEIALCGEDGASIADFKSFVSKFYREVDPEENNSPVTPDPTAQRKLYEKVWQWLRARPDIWIGKQREGNFLLLADAEVFVPKAKETNQEGARAQEAHPEPSTEPSTDLQAAESILNDTGEVAESHTNTEPAPGVPPTIEYAEQDTQGGSQGARAHTSASTGRTEPDGIAGQPSEYHGLRIYTSQDRVWQAIAGHGVDWKRLGKLDFQLLSIITRHGKDGISQPDLARESKQDNRSVPKRTKVLQAEGYITRHASETKRRRAFLLVNRRFTQQTEENDPTTIFVDGHTVSLERLFDYVVKILKERKVCALVDIRQDLGIAKKTWEMTCLWRSMQKLRALGCIELFKAKQTIAGQNLAYSWTNCIRLRRELNPMDRGAFLSLQLERASGLDDTTDEGVALAHDEDSPTYIGDDGEAGTDLSDEPMEIVAGAAEEVVPIPPQWQPIIPLNNLIFNITDSAGKTGISTMDLVKKATSSFWPRPMEQTLGRLTDNWELSQPAFLRHLGLVRDTAMFSQKAPHYVYRTYNGHQESVDAGLASWEAVSSSAGKKQQKAKRYKPAYGSGGTHDLDEWGFQRPQAGKLLPQDGTSSLSKAIQVAKPRSKKLTVKDPRVRKHGDGTEYVLWPKSRHGIEEGGPNESNDPNVRPQHLKPVAPGPQGGPKFGHLFATVEPMEYQRLWRLEKRNERLDQAWDARVRRLALWKARQEASNEVLPLPDISDAEQGPLKIALKRTADDAELDDFVSPAPAIRKPVGRPTVKKRAEKRVKQSKAIGTRQQEEQQPPVADELDAAGGIEPQAEPAQQVSQPIQPTPDLSENSNNDPEQLAKDALRRRIDELVAKIKSYEVPGAYYDAPKHRRVFQLYTKRSAVLVVKSEKLGEMQSYWDGGERPMWLGREGEEPMAVTEKRTADEADLDDSDTPAPVFKKKKGGGPFGSKNETKKRASTGEAVDPNIHMSGVPETPGTTGQVGSTEANIAIAPTPTTASTRPASHKAAPRRLGDSPEGTPSLPVEVSKPTDPSRPSWGIEQRKKKGRRRIGLTKALLIVIWSSRLNELESFKGRVEEYSESEDVEPPPMTTSNDRFQTAAARRHSKADIATPVRNDATPEPSSTQAEGHPANSVLLAEQEAPRESSVSVPAPLVTLVRRRGGRPRKSSAPPAQRSSSFQEQLAAREGRSAEAPLLAEEGPRMQESRPAQEVAAPVGELPSPQAPGETTAQVEDRTRQPTAVTSVERAPDRLLATHLSEILARSSASTPQSVIGSSRDLAIQLESQPISTPSTISTPRPIAATKAQLELSPIKAPSISAGNQPTSTARTDTDTLIHDPDVPENGNELVNTAGGDEAPESDAMAGAEREGRTEDAQGPNATTSNLTTNREQYQNATGIPPNQTNSVGTPKPSPYYNTHKAGVKLGGGSKSHFRTKLVLEILERCGGVFPAQNEIVAPFRAAWIQQFSSDAATEPRIIREAVKTLVDQAKLKRFNIALQCKGGVVVAKQIVGTLDITLASPAIKALQEKMARAHPKSYVPPEAWAPGTVPKETKTDSIVREPDVQVEIQYPTDALMRIAGIQRRKERPEEDKKAEAATRRAARGARRTRGGVSRLARLERRRPVEEGSADDADSTGNDYQNQYWRPYPPLPYYSGGSALPYYVSQDVAVPQRQGLSSSPRTETQYTPLMPKSPEVPAGYHSQHWPNNRLCHPPASTPAALPLAFPSNMRLTGRQYKSLVPKPRELEITVTPEFQRDSWLYPPTEPRGLPIPETTGTQLHRSLAPSPTSLDPVYALENYDRTPMSHATAWQPHPSLVTPTASSEPIYVTDDYTFEDDYTQTPIQLAAGMQNHPSFRSFLPHLVSSKDVSSKPIHTMPWTVYIPSIDYAAIEPKLGGPFYGDDTVVQQKRPRRPPRYLGPSWVTFGASLPQTTFKIWTKRQRLDFFNPEQKFHRNTGTFSTEFGRRRGRLAAAVLGKRPRVTAGLVYSTQRKKVKFVSVPRPQQQNNARRVTRTLDITPDRVQKLVYTVIAIRVLTGGTGGGINFDIMDHVFRHDLTYTKHTFKQRWLNINKNYPAWVERATSNFQTAFLEAYEVGDVPSLNYDKLEQYDWNGLVDWTLQILPQMEGKIPDLPPSRAEVDENYRIERLNNLYGEERERLYFDTAGTGLRAKKLHNYPLSVDYRSSWDPFITLRLRDPELIPAVAEFDAQFGDDISLSMDEYMALKPDAAFALAMSLVRANVFTPEGEYNREVALDRIAQFPHHMLQSAIGAMETMRIIEKNKKDALPSGREHIVAGDFNARLAYGMKLRERHFMQAAAFKAHLDEVFSQEDATFIFSKDADNGTTIVVDNLLEHGKIRLVHRLPKIDNNFGEPFPRLTKWGWLEGSYKAKSVNMNRHLSFELEIVPTEKYEFGIANLSPPPTLDVEDVFQPVPVWVDINGNYLMSVWRKVVCYIVHQLVIRPLMGAQELTVALKETLFEWEIRLVMEWMEDEGIAVGKDVMAVDGEVVERRWSTGERWWLCLGAGEEEENLPNEGDADEGEEGVEESHEEYGDRGDETTEFEDEGTDVD